MRGSSLLPELPTQALIMSLWHSGSLYFYLTHMSDTASSGSKRYTTTKEGLYTHFRLVGLDQQAELVTYKHSHTHSPKDDDVLSSASLTPSPLVAEADGHCGLQDGGGQAARPSLRDSGLWGSQSLQGEEFGWAAPCSGHLPPLLLPRAG